MAQLHIKATDENVLDQFTKIIEGGPNTDAALAVEQHLGETAITITGTHENQPLAFGINSIAQAADAKIVLRMHLSDSANKDQGGSLVRASDSEQTYYGAFNRNQDRYVVRSSVEGSVINLSGDVSRFTFDRDAYHITRLEAVGDQVRFVAYDGTADAPPLDGESIDWDFQTTDTAVTGAGFVGIGHRNDTAFTNELFITDIWVGTDGDEPPVSGATAATAGIPATTLNNADGTASTGTAITRTITRVSDSLQLFTGSQTSDATTGELPAIDLSETDAAVDDVVDDRIVIDGATAPGLKSQTFRITVEDLAEE